jgi:proteasome accessory factor B
MKTTRITRVVKILTALQSGKSYAVSDLTKLFQTSRRTIFRDLGQLRAVGVPYRYNPATRGYTIDPEFFLPPLDLNLQEALSLLLLVHKTSEQIQMPFRTPAMLAAAKIENNLPVRIRQYCSTAIQNVSAGPNPQAPMPHLDETFAQLQRAIAKKSILLIRYNSLFEGKVIELELWPYHLLYNRRAWYVLGFSSLHKTTRTFKLNRINYLHSTGRCFVAEARFDIYDYLGRAWSMIPEGTIYHVKLRFLPKVAANVTEVQWHATQEVTRNADGSATVEFRVDGLGEISWWILGYGDQVQVLAPKALRKRIIETAKNMIEMNRLP